MPIRSLLIGVLVILPLSSLAQSDVEWLPLGTVAAEHAFAAALDYRQGRIDLPGGLAAVDVPEGFYYLSPADTEKVLVQAWGNPPGNDTLGMIVPANRSIFSEDSWGAIISYEEDGHVLDDDAVNLDYDALLSEMQAATRETNTARIEAGYEPIELVGWAAPPHYDRDTHKLYWAKEAKFGDSPVNTLNYNIRVLGRKGVLVVNLVGSMPQLNEITTASQDILTMTEFSPGNRYMDFDPELDQVAAYGIGALVAGKIAAKTGLLAKIAVMLVALKKLWVFIVLGIGALVRWVFRRKNRANALPLE